MIDKNNTVFVEKYEYKNVNDLLNEILRRLEYFRYHNGYTPINLKMTADMYFKIMNYNPNLIKFIKGDGAYILGMKVVF